MAEVSADSRLPIVEEIGEALYAAAVEADGRPVALRWLRGLGRYGRPALVAAIVALGLGASAGGLALAGTFSPAPINPQAWVNGQRVQPEQAIAPDQSAALSILRRPRVASDALPPGDTTLTNSPAASNGANPDLSRRAQGIIDGNAWVIPGDGMICLLFDAPGAGGGTCQTDSSVSDWPPVTSGSARAPGMTTVAGLVPDGVPQVTLTISGN
ncbi:MAG: hypothetical protein ACRDPA_20085, partial [Solirubrobacteraceae bacterium]